MAHQGDVRAVLQYVPQFRGKTFVVLIEAGLLPEPAIAETLLDLAAVEDIGVQLVLGVLGGDLADLYDWTLECEMRSAMLRRPLADADSVAEALTILSRGQTVVADASSGDPLDPGVVDFAIGIGAVKIIALLAEGVLVDGRPVPALAVAEAETLASSPSVTNAHLLRAAARACRRGVPRAHILSGLRQGVLVDELFSNEGVGTMVHADSYRAIRPLREEDIPELLAMIGRSVRRTKLVARTYEDIQPRLADYHVMTIDDNVVGCVALHPYLDDDAAEIACLYVKMSHEGRGYGIELVRHAEDLAEARGIGRVFALTTMAADFFQRRLGYRPCGPDSLPGERLRMLGASGRGSQAFDKRLRSA